MAFYRLQATAKKSKSYQTILFVYFKNNKIQNIFKKTSWIFWSNLYNSVYLAVTSFPGEPISKKEAGVYIFLFDPGGGKNMAKYHAGGKDD